MAAKHGRIHCGSDRSVFGFTLLVGFLGGVFGVLVDLDHLPVLWGGQASRAFHTPLLFGAGFVAFYCLARLGRLLVGQVLSRKGASHDF